MGQGGALRPADSNLDLSQFADSSFNQKVNRLNPEGRHSMRERPRINRLRGSILRDQEQFYDASAPIGAFPKGTTFLPAFGSHHCAQASIIALRFSSASPRR